MQDPLLWTLPRIKRVDNHPFDLRPSPYLLDMFQDDAEVTVTQKSAQTRASITYMCRFLHRVGAKQLNGIYYFPTDEAMGPFVQGRFDPMIAANPELDALIAETNSISIKKLGNAVAYFYGLRSKSHQESFAADHEVFDELDLMLEKDVETALQRMEASSYHRVDYLSTPTLPGIGINRKFLASDQKHYNLKCDHCGANNFAPSSPDDTGEEVLPFPDCIEQGFLACRKCRLPLDITKEYEWVPKYPGREISGRHVSRLFAPNANLKKLMQDFLTGLNRENVFNRGLGMAYADTESRITKEQILSLCGGDAMATSSLESTTAGVDVGHDYLRVVISRKAHGRLREYPFIGTVLGERMNLWTRLKDLFTRFNVKRYVIDGEPETTPVREFIEVIYRRDGWMCDYVKTIKGPTWDKNNHLVKVDRTDTLDKSHKLFRDRLILLPRRGHPDVETFAEECSNLQRKRDVDDNGKVSYSWVHSESDPDHFRHAFNYDALTWYQGEGLPAAAGNAVPKKIRQILQEES